MQQGESPARSETAPLAIAQRVAAGRENRYNQHQHQQQQQPEQRRKQDEQQMNSNNNIQLEPNQVAAAAAAATVDSSNNSCKLKAPQTGRSASNRGKFIKSKSSPSSLTTHKFGLRPTPSPPRLIIDHQTGDIVERYPENPVYLRTYQPIDDSTNADFSEEDDDATQDQIDDSLNTISSQRPQSRLQQQQQRQPEAHSALMADFNRHTNTTSRPNQNHHAHHSSRPQQQQPQQHHGQVIPPPHSGKVYFAPPATSNNLFDPQLQQQQQQQQQAQNLRQVTAAPIPNASFRRALNSLSDTERTDIAILTEPDDSYDGHQAPQMKVTATSASKAGALLAKQQPRAQVISTNASKLYGQPAHSRSPSVRSGGDKWKASAAAVANTNANANANAANAGYHQERQGKQQQHCRAKGKALPAVEDSDLYGVCYNFRVLVVLLISALIVYLLAWPLSSDCAKYRPTYAYVSIITASVNLISVLVFTLFWYCSSVSRTLYQNLSSSAFIVTIYSILVCINLTIGIVFFFINTCHFQKLLATPSVLAEVAHAHAGQPAAGSHLPVLLTADDLVGPQQGEPGELSASPPYSSLRRQQQQQQQQQLVLDEIIETIERQLGESDKARLLAGGGSSNNFGGPGEHSKGRARRQPQVDQNDEATVIDDQLGQRPPTPPATAAPSTVAPTASTSDFFNQDHASGYAEVPELSPIEAAWKYLREEAHLFWRQFYKFLLHYDLKFIGALHAICAACFQYLAIKVAVVRSFYCAPMEPYA